MEKEKELVEDGTLGIIGSPFQQSRGGGDTVQREQRTPKGTPSEGRPRGRPAKKPQEDPSSGDSSNKDKASAQEVAELLSQLSLEELQELVAVKKEEAQTAGATKSKPRRRKSAPKKDQ